MVLVVVFALVVACGNFEGPTSVQNASDAGDAAADAVGPPPGCDPALDPKDGPKCVVDAYGIFVDGASGNDTNPGTKASPVKTIGGAL